MNLVNLRVSVECAPIHRGALSCEIYLAAKKLGMWIDPKYLPQSCMKMFESSLVWSKGRYFSLGERKGSVADGFGFLPPTADFFLLPLLSLLTLALPLLSLALPVQ